MSFIMVSLIANDGEDFFTCGLGVGVLSSWKLSVHKFYTFISFVCVRLFKYSVVKYLFYN